MKYFIVFLLILLGFSSYSLFSQQSSDAYTRVGELNSNNVKVIISNNGILGQPSSFGPTVSWKYAHNGYLGDLSFLIGVELPIKDYTGDNIPDTLHEVIITPVSRPGGGNNNGINGEFGGFEPDTGYFNPSLNVQGEGIAISNLPETWPLTWPDHPEFGQNVWDGFFGKDSLAGNQEAYFQVDDRADAKYYKLYKFLPDTTDSTRYGFGITVNVRYIELNNPLFKDILFRVYDIKNESNFNYSKVVFGNLAGTYIGGTGDEYNDDISFFDSTNKVIYTWDKEPELNIPYVRPFANPNWLPNPYSVGTAGETFLQSSDTNKIKSFNYFIPAGAISLADQNDMWKRLTAFPNGSPGSDSLKGEDGDYIYGSGIFPLNSGQTKRIATALVFGNNQQDVLSKVQLAQALWNNNFNITNIFNEVSFVEPAVHKTLSGTENIQWTSKNSGGYVDLWFSPDAGSSWINLIRNYPNTGSYSWNTTLYKDCSFGQLKIIIKDDNKNIYGINKTDYFSINNNNSSGPFVKILNTEFDSTTVFTGTSHIFNLLIGDNEKDSLLCKVYYAFGGDTTYYLGHYFYVLTDTNAQNIGVDFNDIANSDLLKIKLEVSDGSLTYSTTTPYFDKQTPRQYVDSTKYKKISGYAQVPVKIIKVDPSEFKPDNYQITFDDTSSTTQKTFSVYDLTEKNFLLKNTPLIPNAESPVFDGLALYTEDITTGLDTIRSHWNHQSSNNLEYSYSQFSLPSINLRGINYPFDYMMVFSDSYNDTSNILSIFKNKGINLPLKRTNFKVYDITDPNHPVRIQYAMTESGTKKLDTLSANDLVFLSNHDGTALSWRVEFLGMDNSNVPKGGDTLFLYTTKGLSYFDTLDINSLVSSVNTNKQVPIVFSLEQNYPNPFNPTTIIEYSIPQTGIVSLMVYDILGREIKTLVNQYQNKGKHEINFNASNLASGVYFYQLRSGSFVSTKKMLLLK
jgi:hypothetical protein